MIDILKNSLKNQQTFNWICIQNELLNEHNERFFKYINVRVCTILLYSKQII